ncbi:catalase [Herbaspirillum frisingense GSF30]|uniref:Catalase n=1 Tax=Herbaspirillum frisingense GSF30 TaxID=864073 RepID=A0AAI9N1F3_9BURK|nr:hypothetical protein [Herbaspirillum frisingense]EOA02300.1 catalase [Herbaspirillum frisingense GSF30]
MLTHGVDGTKLTVIYVYLRQQVTVRPAAGRGDLRVEITLLAAPSTLYDAVIIVEGEEALMPLAANLLVTDFLRDQYRICWPVLGLGIANIVSEKVELPRGPAQL